MKVYVETNFVLELALEQAQHESCEQLLRLAEDGRIELVIPAYSLVEPHETLRRRHLNRERFKVELDAELRLLSRSAGYTRRLERFREIIDLLVDSAKEETRRLERLRLRIVAACAVLPLDTQALEDAVAHRMAYGLSPQDSIVYAVVLSNLWRSGDDESFFFNRDRGDFGDPNVVDELRRRRCTLIPSFDHGLKRVLNRLEPHGGSAPSPAGDDGADS